MRLATIAIDRSDATTAAVITPAGAIPVEGYRDVGALLAAGDGGLAAARAAAAAAHAGLARPLAPGTLRAPVLQPGATVCVGLNYSNHVLEMGRELPKHPTLFSKLPRALAQRPDRASLPAPSLSQQADWEGELVVVIGRRVGGVLEREQARDAIAGYTLMNDLSVRDVQRRTTQWFAGKNIADSTPTGPWLVTADEFGDPARHELVLEVNGEQRQRSSLGELIFDAADLVVYVAQLFALEPGDLIATGTPGGVGQAMTPPQYLRDGDRVTVTVAAIGTLETTFGVPREPARAAQTRG
ncbi:fumarylacetoacetate hydrolase family protein [Conexibacter sp. CPCC 206217]|uniref:fumarylacetoacetate hydrolase family protein n=1 Tax=Conexibacter sp. CPCC 206217 TaxID=3064574 RepID=UPI00271EDD34|nr:fumarylacetoacetate hydrolase family protein [Conexibacter sp. CPCC 206217]MDO8211720.1 fumarylacetoacetate hydrolase family protein [Conexibacter sp. CPCC 206217]